MAYLQDPGTILSNATFGPGAFNEYLAAQGLGGLLGYVQNKGDPITNPFGESVQETPTEYQEVFGLTGKGLEGFGSNAEAVQNPSNIKVVGKTPEGGYLVMSKSGDKVGTVYAVLPQQDGTYKSMGVVKENVPFDTNTPWWKTGGLAILGIASAPLMAYGAAQAAQALGVGGGAAGAAGAFPVGSAELASMGPAWTGATGAGGIGSVAGGLAETIGAADGLVNAGSGLAPGHGVAGGAYSAPGMTSAASATGAPLAFQGTDTLLNNLQNIPGTENLFAPEGLEDVVRMPEVEVTGTPPGPPTDLPPPVPPGPPTPNWDEIAPIPPIPGQNPGLPNLPGGGGNNNSNPLGLINLLQWMLDARNKYELGKDQLAFFDDKWKKIFGQSDQFENMLMGTYKDPASYYQGVEGQALGDMMENRLMRQDFKSGLGTNSTNRERLFQQGMLSNLGNHRTGLLNSAALGRNASSAALDAAGKAFQGFADSRNFMSPIAFGAGNSGAGLQDIWNIGKDIWNTGTNLWNWATGG